MLQKEVLSFNDMPQALAYLINKVDRLETLLNTNRLASEETDQWFNIDELIEYLPDHPTKSCIYTWTSTGYIPSIKKGKKLIFSKKDIDNWLKTGKRKSAAEIHAEAMQALDNKKKGVAA